MSCYHPYVLIKTSNLADPVQRKRCEVLNMVHKGQRNFKSSSILFIPREIAEGEGIKLEECNAITVPCGRCIGCRLDYSREWAVRCMKEVEHYDHNWFLTLDYDDEHLPIGSKGIPTLVPDDVSAFMKRLRKALKDKYDFDGVRFFACGEYGDQSLRPHLHIILINCPLPDVQERHPIPVDGKIKLIKQYDTNGEQLLYSPLVGSCWKNGRSPLGQVTFESCAYVSRYIVKKQFGEGAKEYDAAGVLPPFVRMSRNPGIGHAWFMENMDHIIEFDGFSLKRGEKVVNMKPPKYFYKLLKEIDPDLYYSIKIGHQIDLYDSIDCKTFEAVDLVNNNRKAEQVKIQSAKLLKRNL